MFSTKVKNGINCFILKDFTLRFLDLKIASEVEKQRFSSCHI